MKILLITSEYGIEGGGLSFACCHFHKMLTEKLGHEVTLCSSVTNDNVTAIGGYKPALSKSISNEYRLKSDYQNFKNQNIDLVLAFGGSFNAYYSSILARQLNSQFILMLRGTDANLAKWDNQERMYFEESIKIAQRIVCLSEEMKNNVSLLMPSSLSKVVVIPNTIESIFQKVTFTNLPRMISIGTAATHINEKKGIANLLYMVSEFRKISNPYIRLDVVGSIDDDLKNSYLSIINELGIKDNIRLIGYKCREEYYEVAKKWDFYIQGSICEGFGISVSEAIVNGRGIILSPTSYIAESLKKDYEDILFDDWNPSNMARKLDSLIRRNDLMELYNNAYSEILRLTKDQEVENEWKRILISKKPVECKRSNGILTVYFHEIEDTEHDHITTPIDVFEKFADDLYNKGFGLCSMAEYLKNCEKERDKWIVCTFDDGYATLVTKALPILNKYGFTATVFVNSNMIGKDNSWNWKDSKARNHLDEDGIQILLKANWEIGSHGHTHKNLLRLTEKDVTDELKISKEILEHLVEEVETFAYPYGANSPFIQKICNRYYKYAFSLHQGGAELSIDNMQIRRYTIDDIYKILGL